MNTVDDSTVTKNVLCGLWHFGTISCAGQGNQQALYLDQTAKKALFKRLAHFLLDCQLRSGAVAKPRAWPGEGPPRARGSQRGKGGAAVTLIELLPVKKLA